ncbi:MAG: 2-C-methyl-D-erythritol 2,4-cyclodiphosphate synthase [Planctomycetes bacterium]|nr:2-C-methyl-D-erythritol 2,4-cyclodiphosphate synthase [Planctomycetota bacterium]
MLRIGEGSDIHPLAFGHPLVIGGFVIADAKGARGHSDADCLTHAVIDALLGAAGLGDIGHHFPDDDDQWKGARSLDLLSMVGEKLHGLGFTIDNIDATVFLQAPNIKPIKSTIAQNIAEALGIQPFQVNIKAKTGEGIGPIGKLEAIEAHAVCLIEEPGSVELPPQKESRPRSISISLPMEEDSAPPQPPGGANPPEDSANDLTAT